MKKITIYFFAVLFLCSCGDAEVDNRPFKTVADISEQAAVDLLRLHVLEEYGGLQHSMGLIFELTASHLSECDLDSMITVRTEESLFQKQAAMVYSTTCKDRDGVDNDFRVHTLESKSAKGKVFDDQYPLDIYQQNIELNIVGTHEAGDYRLLGNVDNAAYIMSDIENYRLRTTASFSISTCPYDVGSKAIAAENHALVSIRVTILDNFDTDEIGGRQYSGDLTFRDGIPFITFEESGNEYALR